MKPHSRDAQQYATDVAANVTCPAQPEAPGNNLSLKFTVQGPTRATVQLLGLNARELYLDPQLIHAYEELSAAPVEDGFTTQAAQGRAVLLQEAVQVDSWLALARGP